MVSLLYSLRRLYTRENPRIPSELEAPSYSHQPMKQPGSTAISPVQTLRKSRGSIASLAPTSSAVPASRKAPPKSTQAGTSPDFLTARAPPIGLPVRAPKEQTAIMIPIISPIICMFFVICATHADCREIKPPEVNPYSRVSATIAPFVRMQCRQRTRIPDPSEHAIVTLNLGLL